MKAESLLSWDKAELADTLADRYADAGDLICAFPSIAKASGMEGDILDEFIDQNWEMILHEFNIDALQRWVDEKEEVEKWEQVQNDYLEIGHEYDEYMDEEFIRSVLFPALMFVDRNPEDLGVLISLSRKS